MYLRSAAKLKRKLEGMADGDGDRKRLKVDDVSLAETDKSKVLKSLKSDKNKSNLLNSELRLFFFAAAALNAKNPNDLNPFPPCFINETTKRKKYGEVKVHIRKIPALEKINESTDLPKLTWELLNWIITQDELTLEPLVIDIPNKIEELKRTTGLKNFPIPNNQYSYHFYTKRTGLDCQLDVLKF